MLEVPITAHMLFGFGCIMVLLGIMVQSTTEVRRQSRRTEAWLPVQHAFPCIQRRECDSERTTFQLQSSSTVRIPPS
jgi:hypothetical protein